jgi:uncharacterized protein (TIRG00374 family)
MQAKVQLEGYQKIIGLVILAVILSKIELAKLVSTFSQVNFSLLVYALVLNIPHIFFKALRWRQFLKKQHILYSLKDSFLIYTASIYAGSITPGRFGEIFVKALYLKTEKSISFSRGMSSIIVDRTFDMYLLLILGVFGVLKFNLAGSASNLFIILIIFVLLAPCLLLNGRWLNTLVRSVYISLVVKKVKDKIGENFEDFFNGLDQLIGTDLFLSGILTGLSYTIFFTQCYLLAVAADVSANFITIGLFMAIANLITMIPISFSGLGTRDATLIYLFSLIGLKAELAVGYSFLVFFTFFIVNGFMGFICWTMRPANDLKISP